jgi:hypothetical protein
LYRFYHNPIEKLHFNQSHVLPDDKKSGKLLKPKIYMTHSDSKKTTVQKPLRCPVEFEVSLNKARGALMLQSGARISENRFLLELLELGLEALNERIETGTFSLRVLK